MSSGTQLAVVRPRSTARFAHTIYREDIDKLDQLSALFSLFRDLYTEHRDFVLRAVDNGATVEGGREAWIVIQEAGGFVMPRYKQKRLRWR